MRASLFRGRVLHTRHLPLVHSFGYPVFFCSFDLAELPRLNDLWPLAGYNRRAILAVRDRDYLGAGPGSILEKFCGVLAGRPAAGRVARVELLTVPRVLGYSYNPANFYLGYDAEALVCAVVEINNTYGETHLYVLDEQLPSPPGSPAVFAARKEFFVSPFFDLRGEYRFQFARSADAVEVSVNLHREDRPALSASLEGQSRPLTRWAIVSTLLRYPLSAALTMPRIAWQARQLKRKGLPALLKPEPTSPMTIRRMQREASSYRA
jgi:cyclopropane-fatty-acyl-phospholipid synthase